MTLLRERLLEAQERKENDIKNFTWLYPKDRDNGNIQNEVKLVSCTEEQLKGFYSHCNKMLYNDSKENPGRVNVLKIIQDQITKIGVELMLRDFESKNENFDRFSFALSIDEFLEKNKDVDSKVATIKNFIKVPRKYEDLTLYSVYEGCIGKLGLFENPHITRSFILRMGLWLNKGTGDYKKLKEWSELNKLSSLNTMEKVYKYLRLREYDKLRSNPTGLNLSQMKGMLEITHSKKYTDLTTEQLVTLRYRVLLDLRANVRSHISKWETLKHQIELVAESKGFKL
jgi:hypothetical protein